MREVNKQDLIEKIDEVVIKLMDKAIYNDFDENAITHSLLSELKDIFTSNMQDIGLKIILDNSVYKYASFEAYKVRGKAEKHFGDILGIICLGSDNSFYIGMFSLEAKIIKDGRMKSFEYDQLIRLLRNNVFIKWIIYDKDEKHIDVINPRILLNFNAGIPKRQHFSAFTIPLSTYIIEFLLNGNDSFLFIKKNDGYIYPPYDSQGDSPKSLYSIVNYYIEKIKRLPPSYILTLNSHTNEATFRKGLDVLQDVIMSIIPNIFPNQQIEPVKSNSINPPDIKPPDDPKPPNFGPGF